MQAQIFWDEWYHSDSLLSKTLQQGKKCTLMLPQCFLLCQPSATYKIPLTKHPTVPEILPIKPNATINLELTADL